MSKVYVDGLGNVSIIENVARLELFSLMPDEDGKLKPVTTESLYTSLPGLIRIHQQLTKTIDKLVSDGLLKKEVPNSTN